MAREFVFTKTCNEDWHGMAGAARERFCGECQRTVTNLSAMTRRQAERLVSESEGRVCGRIVLDGEGRPVFRSAVELGGLRRLVQISALGAAAVVGAAAQSEAGSCRVEVSVSDQSHTMADGAKVSIIDAATTKSVATGVTSREGTLSVSVPRGIYSMTVELAGFQRASSVVKCTGETASAEVEMKIAALMGSVVVVTGHPSWRYRLTHPRMWL